jgi:DNA-binding MarR family transcriptional regulator
MGKSKAIAPNDKRVIETLLWALQPFSSLRQHRLPLRTVIAFLVIARDEGKALNDYAYDLKVHRAYMSQILHDLADRARDGRPGLGLVQINEEKRGKRLEIFLTDKGHAVAKAMFDRQTLLALQPFLNLRPVALRTVTAFLIIASNEGKSPADYARYLKTDRSSMSKIIYDLADRARDGGPGLGLVQIDEPSTPRTKQAVFLTKKGRAFARTMFEQLRNQQILVGLEH